MNTEADSNNDIPELNEAVLALEWDRFLELAEPEARTESGKAALLSWVHPENWAREINDARLRQQETQEITALLDRDALWGPLIGLTDPTTILENLSRGAILELQDLAQLRSWLYAIGSWNEVPRDQIHGEHFKKALASLPDASEPLRILERILTPDGQLSEKASPKLAGLFAEIRALKRQISIELDHLLKTFSQKGVLQENFSDVRDGRYVIPVKISCQNDVEGIIYEASASRQTVFVEPKEVAPLNNRLRQRQNDLTQEILAILEDTSKRLKPFSGEISQSALILSHWDAVQARARFGLYYGGKSIQVSEERKFILHQTAHPLLWWSMPPEEIIRNEIEFGEPARTLLLSGPNTGGKTVFLKTLGIAGICAKTGFLFPGTDQPIVPFFDSFFADVGDPQSLENNLSSFAGHILQFREILESITERSLVLLDELNTATDPEEGAALGRAFLETLMKSGNMTVATTHDPGLKALSLTDQRILSASMAFDEEARTPTYRMLLGVPGRSRALETAERLGMPTSVLELARTYLTHGHEEFENLLDRLENDAKAATHARQEAERIKKEAERLRKEWTDRTTAAASEILDRTRQKLRRILETAQNEVRASVQKLDEMRTRKELDHTRGTLSETFSRSVGQIEETLREEAPEIAESLQIKNKETASPAEVAAQLREGMTVRVPKWKSTGKVMSVQDGKAKVAMGAIQMTLSFDEVEMIEQKPAPQPTGRQRDRSLPPPPPAPPPQLDLRGVRYDDAMTQLEQYLDQAYRSGERTEVTIVHGLGSGALREGTRKLLASLPYIKTFRDGGVGHGGTGATIVEFDLS